MKTRTLSYCLVVALAVFNGIYSSHTILIFALQGIWYPAILPAPFNVMIALSAVIAALHYFLGSGMIPALLERLSPQFKEWSSLIWLFLMVLVSLPTLLRMVLP